MHLLKHILTTLTLACLISAPRLCGEASKVDSEGPVKRAVFLSDVFMIDRFYRSMEGPLLTKNVKLAPDKPQLLWVKRVIAEVVDRENRELSHQDFFCHFNIDHVIASRTNFQPTATVGSHRLATMSQGQMEIYFPANTGVPIHSQEELIFYFQVLNRRHSGTHYVRHRITVEYVEDSALKTPLLPLFAHAGMVIKTLDTNVTSWNEYPQKKACTCCRSLSKGDRFPTGMGYIQDTFGHRFASHWKVEPGQSECATPLHSFMPMPYTTSIHAVSPHVHPYAQWLKLVDGRSQRELFMARIRTATNAAVLEHIDYPVYPVSSNVLLEATAAYELVVGYNNPTPEDQDAMAMAVFYLHDRTLRGLNVMGADLLALHRKQPNCEIGGCGLIPASSLGALPKATLPEMK